MKLSYLLLLFTFFSCGITYAEEILLNINNHKIPQYDSLFDEFDKDKLEYKKEEERTITSQYKTIRKMYDDNYYKSKTISNKKEKKLGKMKLGTKSDITIKPNEASSSRTLYSDYALSKKMSVIGSYNAETLNGYKVLPKGTVSGGMEYKLTKRTSIKNIYSKNLNDRSNKTELKLRYKPLKDDRFDINVGAGQKLFYNGQPTSSQFNFDTNLKF